MPWHYGAYKLHWHYTVSHSFALFMFANVFYIYVCRSWVWRAVCLTRESVTIDNLYGGSWGSWKKVCLMYVVLGWKMHNRIKYDPSRRDWAAYTITTSYSHTKTISNHMAVWRNQTQNHHRSDINHKINTHKSNAHKPTCRRRDRNRQKKTPRLTQSVRETSKTRWMSKRRERQESQRSVQTWLGTIPSLQNVLTNTTSEILLLVTNSNLHHRFIICSSTCSSVRLVWTPM